MDHMILDMEEEVEVDIMAWLTRWDNMDSKCLDMVVMENTMVGTKEDIMVR